MYEVKSSSPRLAQLVSEQQDPIGPSKAATPCKAQSSVVCRGSAATSEGSLDCVANRRSIGSIVLGMGGEAHLSRLGARAS
jgi:hypothetical protein